MLVAALIWGLAFSAQRSGTGNISPFFFNGVRYLLGAVALLPVLFMRKTFSRKIDWKKVIFAGIVCGICAGLGANLQQIALATTEAGKAGFLTTLYIIFVPILGLFFGKKAPPFILPAILFATVGFYFLSVSEKFTLEKGDMLLLIAAVTFAFHIVFIDLLGKDLDSILFSVAQFTTVGVLSLVYAFLFEEPSVAAIQRALIPILYTGLASTGIATTLQVVGQKGCNPSAAALILSLESVFSVLGGAIILGERLSGRGIMGCILIFCGIIIAQIERKK
jgi:drug/metabolite transporter (DMT)-like permease